MKLKGPLSWTNAQPFFFFCFYSDVVCPFPDGLTKLSIQVDWFEAWIFLLVLGRSAHPSLYRMTDSREYCILFILWFCKMVAGSLFSCL